MPPRGKKKTTRAAPAKRSSARGSASRKRSAPGGRKRTATGSRKTVGAARKRASGARKSTARKSAARKTLLERARRPRRLPWPAQHAAPSRLWAEQSDEREDMTIRWIRRVMTDDSPRR